MNERTGCKGVRENFGELLGAMQMVKMVILTVEVITQIHIFVKIHQMIYFKWVKFIAHILSGL